MPRIKGGYYIKARCIQNSDIAQAPPHIREIWDWLLKECNHSDKKVADKIISRGQCIRSYKDIIDGLKWYVGYRKMTYSKSNCETAMKWLTKRNMITTKKTTRGIIITICNYNYYQDPENYENHTETGNEATIEPQSSHTINKKEKKEKKENNKEIIYPEWLDISLWNDFKDHRKKLRKPLTLKAEDILLTKLGALKEQGHEPRNLLITAIERGWQSVFAPNN